MKEVTIGQLRRHCSEENLRQWIPCLVFSDGTPIAVISPFETSQVKPPSADHPDAPEAKPKTTAPKAAAKLVKPFTKEAQSHRSRKPPLS